LGSGIDGAIVFSLHHQGPDQSCITGCQCHDGSQVTAALDQIPNPATQVILFVTQIGDHGSRAMDQAHAQIFIPAPGDAP
jgi:hypothetical protein